MRTIISNQQFDEERALYGLRAGDVINCLFAGPADGESVLKEARDVNLTRCDFSLRYPLWHVEGFSMEQCNMDEKTRAAIWYATGGQISHCNLGGIKAVRECKDIHISDSDIVSQEFGWKSENISLKDCSITAEYVFLDSKDVTLENVQMKGKYSFQYMENLTIRDSYLDTKDAFWHSKNVTVVNSTVKGEYLAWFSDGDPHRLPHHRHPASVLLQGLKARQLHHGGNRSVFRVFRCGCHHQWPCGFRQESPVRPHHGGLCGRSHHGRCRDGMHR